MKRILAVYFILVLLLFLTGCVFRSELEAYAEPVGAENSALQDETAIEPTTEVTEPPTQALETTLPEVSTEIITMPEVLPIAPVISPLVGTWRRNADTDLGDGLFNYDIFVTYNSNGTGTTLHHVTDDWQISVDFTWSAENGVVILTTIDGGRTTIDTWAYGVVGNVLTFYQEGETLVFQRAETPTIASTTQLIGAWYIIEDGISGSYTFNSDGTGVLLIASEGIEMSINFTWTATNENISMTTTAGGETEVVENFSYWITGDILTLYDNGEIFSLHRVQ